MIKDYECIMYPNTKVQPEPETGCRIYVDVNNHKDYGMHLPGGSDVMPDEKRRQCYTDASLEKDANGNLLLYTSLEKDKIMKRGYVFTEKNRIPYIKITRGELFHCYKIFHEKRLTKEIARFEEIEIKNNQQYNELTAAQKKELNYRPDIIKRDMSELQGYKDEKVKVKRWYADIEPQPNLKDTAYARQNATGLLNLKNWMPRLAKASRYGRRILIFTMATNPSISPNIFFYGTGTRMGLFQKKNHGNIYRYIQPRHTLEIDWR